MHPSHTPQRTTPEQKCIHPWHIYLTFHKQAQSCLSNYAWEYVEFFKLSSDAEPSNLDTNHTEDGHTIYMVKNSF